MNDLYIKFMEWILPFLQAHFWLFIIGVGALYLLGAVFRWKWVCDPQGENVLGFRASVYRSCGEKGYRILQGLGGITLILCGAALWVLM